MPTLRNSRNTSRALSALSLIAGCSAGGAEPGVQVSQSSADGSVAIAETPPPPQATAASMSPAAAGRMAMATRAAGAQSQPSAAGAAQSGAGSGAAGMPAAVGGAGASAAMAGAMATAGVAGTASTGPRDYGARGPFEVLVEKNIGESFRNTNLTDDAARCAALVSGLGSDADGGDWAIYPDDMDRQLYTMFRPHDLGEGVKYPVITWGNGTCSQPLLFEPLLGHLASHGFIVIASNWRWVAGGVEMRRALDFVIEENDNPDSALYGKVAVEKLGASGHSQGSTATVTVGADARVVVTVPIQGASASGVGQLAGPTFLIAGDQDMSVSAASVEAAFRAARVPAVYGLSLGHDHVMPVRMPEPILQAVTAWFRIHLADDAEARPLFYAPCKLCDDPTWRVETANL